MTDKRPHRGLALGKQLHDAQQRSYTAMETIIADEPNTGDLTIATIVDHENRLEALEFENETLKRNLSTLAHMFTAHLENALGVSLEGHLADLKTHTSPGDEFGPCEAENDASGNSIAPFQVIDGDLKGEGRDNG